MNRTYFVDIDGTLFVQKKTLTEATLCKMKLCDGVIEAFDRWNWEGAKIVLVTGRKESSRPETEAQLRGHGLYWDHLLMGLDVGGQRILINNLKSNSAEPTALAFCPAENEGLSSIKI